MQYFENLNQSVDVAEVEKQLQGSGTPQLAYKKPHAGSTGNIHGLVVMSEQVAAVGMVGGEPGVNNIFITTISSINK